MRSVLLLLFQIYIVLYLFTDTVHAAGHSFELSGNMPRACSLFYSITTGGFFITTKYSTIFPSETTLAMHASSGNIYEPLSDVVEESNNSVPRYLSDEYPAERIPELLQHEKVLIDADTGSGKTTFIYKSLAPTVKDLYHGKVLELFPRTALREQQRNSLCSFNAAQCCWWDEIHNIYFSSYQAFIEERWTEQQQQVIADLKEFTVIVCDESHYFFSDCEFNNRIDFSLEALVESSGLPTCLFMSATNQDLCAYFSYIGMPYFQIHSDIHNCAINSLTFFPKDEKSFLIDSLTERAQSEHSCILFGLSNLDEAVALLLNLQSKYGKDSVSFVCSQYQTGQYQFLDEAGHRQYGHKYTFYMNSEQRDSLIITGSLQAPFTIATTAFDIGFSITDVRLKYIFTDFAEPFTIKQFIGRKRCGSDALFDAADVFICNRNNYQLGHDKAKLSTTLSLLDEFNSIGAEAYFDKYNETTLSRRDLSKETANGYLRHDKNFILAPKKARVFHATCRLQRLNAIISTGKHGFQDYMHALLGSDISLRLSSAEQLNHHAQEKLRASQLEWLQENEGRIFCTNAEKDILRDVLNQGKFGRTNVKAFSKVNTVLFSFGYCIRKIDCRPAGSQNGWKLCKSVSAIC